MDLHDGSPYWSTRDGLPASYPPLDRDRSCDVAVVGAGITGTLIALELHARGFDVVVLDRRDAAMGSTAASTSMLQYEIDELMIDLADAYSEDVARTCYTESARGIDLVARTTERLGVSCGFRRSPSVFIAVKRRDVPVVRAEMDARAAAGFDVRWLEPEELRERWGLDGIGAVESTCGASVDPYALAHAGLSALKTGGASIFDRTEVTSFELSPRRVRLVTDRGSTVSAKWCVVATGYEVADLVKLPISLLSTFAFVSEPVADLARRYPDGLLFWEYADPYLYGRTTDDGRILVGGRDEQYRDARRRGRALPAKARALARDAAQRLPAVELEVGFSWCGTFAETPDGLPYIGVHPSLPRCRFALGFGGNGITYSALAADYIASELTGNPVSAAEMFRLDRPERRPS